MTVQQLIDKLLLIEDKSRTVWIDLHYDYEETEPDTVTEIGENSFSDAVIICPEGSFAETYVLEHQMQYIISER